MIFREETVKNWWPKVCKAFSRPSFTTLWASFLLTDPTYKKKKNQNQKREMDKLAEICKPFSKEKIKIAV